MLCPMRSLVPTAVVFTSNKSTSPLTSALTVVPHNCSPCLHCGSSHLDVQMPKGTSQRNGTEFGMHLELVETGYENKKVKVKTKQSNPAKQVQHHSAD